eukprot:Protomagalhaensia_sp_Gyna_25__4116@NODE_372_length_3667_cov_82_937431_g286_i0_p3_GENE_NODE_372_length_3667_cov_82_937431_g286_i0NODE_372_length_3667_cov_82_937431_g286_i0_p3_ORF_typecomplete_len185_score18_36PSS/PF03034_15/3_9e32_NODE_372_length_3667_cov_82_937431_g286_i014472001
MKPSYSKNFRDLQIILDVLGCNLLGMWLGMKICEKWKLKAYAWGRPSLKKFTPHFDVDNHCYSYAGWFAQPSGFMSLCGLTVLVTVFDLNYFFLKAILRLNPGHWICLLRTLVMGLAAAPTLTELQIYLEGGWSSQRYRRMGVQAWLLFAAVTCELLLIIRWAPVAWMQAAQPWYSKVRAMEWW